MDNPGQSLFIGGSIHIDNIRPPDPDEEEEDEEEHRQREAEIQGMLANAFDDLEEDESFVNASSHYSLISNQAHLGSNEEQQNTPRFNIRPGSPHGLLEIGGRSNFNEAGDYENTEHSVPSHIQERQTSQSDGDAPWSDDSDDNTNNFNSLAYQETAKDFIQYTDQEGLSNRLGHSFLSQNNSVNDDLVMGANAVERNQYSADKYKSRHFLDPSFKHNTSREEFFEAETSNDQLKLLYEARGRELDRVMEELSKARSESTRSSRILQHQINLLTSENESKQSNLKHYQTLVSEKDEIIKKMKQDNNELQKKNLSSDDRIKKIQLELESAESTIASLECQIAQLKSSDSLARNQQLHDEFIKKLRQGNEDEKDMLIKKLQIVQKECESHQEDANRLREQLKTLRKTHDDLHMQKTEAVTKLSVTLQKLQKQYEDLLQSHGSQKILELQLRNKSLENDKERLENNVKILEQELQSAKDDVKGYESVFMYGIVGEAIPAEDSIAELGIKRALNYDDRVARENTKGNQEPMSEAQIKQKMRDELKRSLLANKVKRDEITRLQEETREKQDLLRRTQSDLKSSQVEIKELKENLLRLKLELAEKQMQGTIRGETSPSLKEVQSENILLKQEILLLLGSFRHLKQSTQEFSSIIQNARKNSSDSILAEGPNGLVSSIDRVLQVTTDLNECISNLEKYQSIISQLREEICKLHEESDMWEKRLSNIEIKLVVSSQMIETATFDHGNASEYLQAQNVLKTLYEDIKLQIQTLKKHAHPSSEKTAAFQGQLASLKLELEREKEKNSDLMRNNEALQVDIVVITQKKDEEKNAALQSCQDTYMKFHEDAMKELETKYNVEYETIGAQLKHEITRLAEELSNVKGLYIAVCEEKNILEERLNDYVRKLESHPASVVAIDSRVKLGGGGGLDASSQHDRKLKELESKVNDEQNIWEIERKKLTKEKEELEKKYHEISKKAEELQKKCSILDECNQILKDKIGDSEDDTARTKPNILLSEGAFANELERCQEILKTQRNQFEKEQEEQKAQFSREISDLKEKLARVNRMRAEEVEAKHAQEITLHQLEKQIQSLMGKAEESHLENEQEAKRLTEMILNLESELREQQEKFNKSKILFEGNIRSLRDEQSELKKELEEVQSKYTKLKRAFTAYKKASDEQRSYYNVEISRINSEYRKAKDLIIKRVQEYFEMLKNDNIKCVESIINFSKDIGDKEERIKQIMLMLEELIIQIRDFSLKFL